MNYYFNFPPLGFMSYSSLTNRQAGRRMNSGGLVIGFHSRTLTSPLPTFSNIVENNLVSFYLRKQLKRSFITNCKLCGSLLLL